jgi:hypothetical protein
MNYLKPGQNKRYFLGLLEEFLEVLLGRLGQDVTRIFFTILGFKATNVAKQCEMFLEVATMFAHQKMEANPRSFVPRQTAIQGIGYFA